MSKFALGIKTILGWIVNIVKEVWKFVTDVFQDFENHWDPKPIFGVGFLGFAVYYLGWLRPGDAQGFLAVAGIGLGLLGWAASPWGAGDPRPRVITTIQTSTDGGGK
jgi:hypothetical protein